MKIQCTKIGIFFEMSISLNIIKIFKFCKMHIEGRTILYNLMNHNKKILCIFGNTTHLIMVTIYLTYYFFLNYFFFFFYI